MFEQAVVDMLNKCGFKAWRTNQSNEADSERYKAGFDGGVDFIATFDVVKPIHRNVCFYIQCKCHKEPLSGRKNSLLDESHMLKYLHRR